MSNTSKPTHIETRSRLLRRIACCLVLCAACLGTPHAVSVASAQDAFIIVETAPPRYREGPRTVYRGRSVYYTDGRWYRRDGDRWGYYREEPRELVRYRREYREPPPRRHRHSHRDRGDAHIIVERP